MKRVVLFAAVMLFCVGPIAAYELPSWIDVLTVTLPDEAGVGSIALSGEWLDTCVPDTISHEIVDDRIDLLVEHPGINVGCGDAITPWSLTEPLGPLAAGSYSIYAALYAVDPSDPSARQLVSGPDLLVADYAVPEPSAFVLLATAGLGLLAGQCLMRQGSLR